MSDRSEPSRHQVELFRGEQRRGQRLSWWYDEEYHVDIDGPGRRREATGPDLFEALVSLRLSLEADGWLIAVQGARLDTYPSGMARDMGGGRQVYVMAPGPTTSGIVATLDPVTDPTTLATVAAQRDNFEQWWPS